MLSQTDKNDNWINQGLTMNLELVRTWWDVRSEQARFGIVLGGREQSDKFFCPLQLENNSVNLDVEEEVRECELSSL